MPDHPQIDPSEARRAAAVDALERLDGLLGDTLRTLDAVITRLREPTPIGAGRRRPPGRGLRACPPPDDPADPARSGS